MSGLDGIYARIEREVAATPGKRVLLVEGTGDIEFLTHMLDKPPVSAWDVHARWAIGAVGGKSNVLRLLKARGDWVGLIDRDAEPDAKLEDISGMLPNLFLLPRFCIENYFIVPEELARAFAPETVRRMAGGMGQVTREINSRFPQAVRHGSLWRTVQPLYDELMAMGFNGVLLKYDLPSDSEVMRVLRGWEGLLEAERIYASYEMYRQEAACMSERMLYCRWVHGKAFWRGCVQEVLQAALPERGVATIKREILRRMPLPEDFLALCERLFMG